MMHLMQYIRSGSTLLILCALGCGGAAGPKLAPVQGKVTVGGNAPFQKGLVRYIPKAGVNLNSREAITDDNGNYKILFSPGKPGLEPGSYTVMFSLFQMPDGSPMPDQTGMAHPKSPKDLGAVQFVPPEFAYGKDEKCNVTITDKGGTFDFDIPELKAPGGKK